MKNLLIIVVLVVGGLVAYNYATSGELSLVPSTASAEEQELKGLEKRFDAARRQYSQAGRVAGMSGIDMTADVVAVQRRLSEIQRELKALRKRISEDRVGRRAKGLARDIKEFAEKLR